uniref:Odorant receptor n=1 Tax=Phlebotomus papatasi TaxID=29031 RepID=A0A3F2ZEA3_PHLPP
MTDLAKCYDEFIKIENFLNRLVKILSCSFFPRKFFFGFEKYTFLAVLVYYISTTISATYYFKGTMLEAIMLIVVGFGSWQILIKVLVPLTNENELNQLLFWIRGLHLNHTFDFVTQAAGTNFKNMQFFIKLFNKIIFPVYFMAAVAVIGYCVNSNSVIHAIPWIPVRQNESNIYHHIHQAFVLPSITAIATPPECFLVTIGFYFIAIQNVLRDMINHLDDSNLENKKHFLRTVYILHSEILNSFRIFNDIYFYVFTVQAVTSSLIIMFLFYIIRIEMSIIFVPLILGIYFQFLLLCIFGEIIYSKTEDIFTNLYLTKWYEFDLSDQKIFLMMMRISQYPFGLKAAGMYDINIVMAFKVMKAGFSFCAILYTFT